MYLILAQIDSGKKVQTTLNWSTHLLHVAASCFYDIFVYRKRSIRDPKNDWKLFWRLIDVSGSNFIFPKTFKSCLKVSNEEKDKKYLTKERNSREKWEIVKVILAKSLRQFTCMPIMAYMKNNMAMSRQTYGSALKDWTKVQSNILIVYPWRRSLIKRAARNSRRKPTLNEFSCLREKQQKVSMPHWLHRILNLLPVQAPVHRLYFLSPWWNRKRSKGLWRNSNDVRRVFVEKYV